MYKLLIVEDETFIRKGLKAGIPWKDYGFRVIGEAANGREALDLVRDAPPDVVMTDIRMPVMNGLDLMQKLRESNPKVRIVILSGYDEFAYAQKGISFGASAYVLKPTKDEEIREVFCKLKNDLDIVRFRDRIIQGRAKQTDSSTERFFLDLVSDGTRDQRGIDRIARNLHIDTAGQFSVLLFEGDISEIDKPSLTPCISGSLKAFPEVRLLEVLVMDTLSRVMIVIACSSRLRKTAVNQLASALLKPLQDHTASMLTAGVGDFTNQLSTLSASYNQAEAALGQVFFLGKGRVHFPPSVCKAPVEDSESLDTEIHRRSHRHTPYWLY